MARQGGLPGTHLVLGVAFCVVIFIPCACGSSGAWAAASKPSGSSLLVTLEPANSGASARGLAADARIFERRARTSASRTMSACLSAKTQSFLTCGDPTQRLIWAS